MKKAFSFLIVGVVFFGIFSVQTLSAQSANDAQRIVGTWVDSRNDITVTFNADGTVTGDVRGDYFISGMKLIVFERGSYYSCALDFYISPNGRVLVIHWDNDEDGYWHVKQ